MITTTPPPAYDAPTIPMLATVRAHTRRRTLRLQWEHVIVASILLLATIARVIACFHTGMEVDEPIYRYAAGEVLHYGFPVVRAAQGAPTIPFLYHPPFYLLELGAWFSLFHDQSLLTGRLFSVFNSFVMLLVLYLVVRQISGRAVALLTLLAVASDAWIIFTNQGIYIEDAQLIFLLLSVSLYWRAHQTTDPRRRALYYALAGALSGFSIIYKLIGGFLFLVVGLHLLFTRKHWRGHLLFFSLAGSVIFAYLGIMHLMFGALFDQATLVQVARTIGARTSAGLTYSPWVALQAIGARYLIFPSTIVCLLAGSALALWRAFRLLFRREGKEDVFIISWALGSVLFALSISLKSPHYMILWLIPLYLLLVQTLVKMRPRWNFYGSKAVTLTCLWALLLLINSWSFHARFFDTSGDTLREAETYMATHVPTHAVVLTEDYIGVDIPQPYLNINYVTTPEEVRTSGAQYIAFYYSTTEPIPASFGEVSRFCTPMKTFSGFKDSILVCKVQQ